MKGHKWICVIGGGCQFFIKQIVDFLIEEFLDQKNRNLELKREQDNLKHKLSSEIRHKTIRLRREQLKFKKGKQEGRRRRYIANLICYLYYLNQKNKNLELKRRDIELKAERLRLRQEWLKFKRDRFESWKKLMEDKRHHSPPQRFPINSLSHSFLPLQR